MTVSDSFTFLDKDDEHYKDTESLFQNAYDSGDKEEQFKCVFRVCYALVLKILRKRLSNIAEDLVYDKALDATIKIMDRIERLKARPNKLTAYCYWPSYECCFGNKQRQFEDQIELWSDYKLLQGEYNEEKDEE